MESIQVNKETLPDGTRYTGWCVNHNGELLPHGCGKKFYSDYYVYGNFTYGAVNGPAIESHDVYMKTMQFKGNQGNGWGLCMNRGQLTEFGYYESNNLKLDLSDFVLWYFSKMLNAERDETMLHVYTNKVTHEVVELIIGYQPSPTLNGVGLMGMGFHFMSDGSIWMGNTASRKFSGILIHFCQDGTIDSGRFENGELLKRMDLQEVIDHYYGTLHFSTNDPIASLLGKREPNPIREQFRAIIPIRIHHNYFTGLPAEDIARINEPNQYSMTYHVKEVDFSATGNFVSIGDDGEDWKIGDSQIITPHGVLDIEDALFVNTGVHVGVQFSVSGWLSLNDFSCSNGDEDDICIATIAIVRQPHNAWVWAYVFDINDQLVVNFCGYDDLDGLANFIPFLKRKYPE